MLLTTHREVKLHSKGDPSGVSGLERQRVASDQEANLSHWYACVYSQRFWQYFFMNFFGTFVYYTFYSEYADIGKGQASRIVKVVSCPIIGYCFARFGYKPGFLGLMVLNCAIAITALIAVQTGLTPIIIQILYSVTIITEVG